MQHELKQALQTELHRILHYWKQYLPDEQQGGFYGKIDHSNTPDRLAPKGAVLNARIMWTFAAAYHLLGDASLLPVARRAETYFREQLLDTVHGGVFWTVDHLGQPLETKKQTYAIAFAIYAYSEYYRVTKEEPARAIAIRLYNNLQQYSYDPRHGGYLEAFTRDWKPLADQRLSEKDANEKKTMNTHLHILEAYANLYTVWPESTLKKNIQDLLRLFKDRIIDRKSGHLHLFFEEQWQVKGHTVSYGHDIEASWLLLEAAQVIQNQELIATFRAMALKMALATEEGLDRDGGLWYEYEPATRHTVAEKHWWPQAEAIVGFVNAWQLQPSGRFLQRAAEVWRFTEKHLLDKAQGEWYWGIREDGTVMEEDKAGLWKCPYHNARACMEIMKRL
ncbi:AGE family epimerase/isomerase [Chitinophaga qingshengii]|uniref:Cellobiose 2-epimerase n=2 Tax=Chitinophaga qingshengii TaxID=1569794 RepID=A0ABR7TS03_9BACT|nr:AGE family epimerase/isomerase [Chitinophaga qingshengii]